MLASLSLVNVTTDQIVQIAIFILILAVAWTVMKAILKITIRMFAFGCGAILVLGLILAFLRWLG